MFISTIIPTVGRHVLKRAVESVLTQEGVGFESEVVVVNDTGGSLSDDLGLESDRVRVVSTTEPGSGPTLGRNRGAAAANGRFLHFLDDDDWMLPGAFEAFARAHGDAPSARWLYGIVRRETRDGERLGTLPRAPRGNVLAHLISGEWLPLQGTLVRDDLFDATGGFTPESAPSEDMDLLLKMSLLDDVYRVDHPVCVYSEGVDDSAVPREECSVRLFEAYDRMFNRPETLPRAIESATTPRLYGRVIRHYLISAKKAWQRGDMGTLKHRVRDLGRLVARFDKGVLRFECVRGVVSRSVVASP